MNSDSIEEEEEEDDDGVNSHMTDIINPNLTKKKAAGIQHILYKKLNLSF